VKPPFGWGAEDVPKLSYSPTTRYDCRGTCIRRSREGNVQRGFPAPGWKCSSSLSRQRPAAEIGDVDLSRRRPSKGKIETAPRNRNVRFQNVGGVSRSADRSGSFKKREHYAPFESAYSPPNIPSLSAYSCTIISPSFCRRTYRAQWGFVPEPGLPTPVTQVLVPCRRAYRRNLFFAKGD